MGFEGGSIVAQWSLDSVEEALVEAHELEARLPAAVRRWPFAGDAPWNLIVPERDDIKGDWSETLIVTEAGKELQVRKIDARRPRAALDAAEVGRWRERVAWLGWIAEPLDRRLVWLATATLAREESRVPWNQLKARLGWGKSDRGLAWRYRKALASIVCRLNGWPQRHVNGLAARGFAREAD